MSLGETQCRRYRSVLNPALLSPLGLASLHAFSVSFLWVWFAA
jgi:hypothetical protein